MDSHSIDFRFPFYEICVKNQWEHKVLSTATLAVRVQLQLGWNTNLRFNSNIEFEAESIVLLIFVLWWYFNCRWVRVGGVGQKVLFRTSRNHILFQTEF